MIRDIPTCQRASRAAFQPLIGGDMKSLQTRSSTGQEARAVIAGDGNTKAWVVIYSPQVRPAPSHPSIDIHSNTLERSPKTAVESEPPTADIT